VNVIMGQQKHCPDGAIVKNVLKNRRKKNENKE